ncbi:MAG: outer membrane beta-barrel protein [Candidatus Hodarchaeota archaeon]
MNKKIIFFEIFIILILSTYTITAKEREVWALNGAVVYFTPLGELSNRFKPTTTLTVGFTQWYNPKFSMEVRLIAAWYNQNSDKLTYKDLDMKLEILGVNFNILYSLNLKELCPYIIGGVGAYHWENQRAELLVDKENVQTTILEHKRDEMSWGFNVGFGLKYRLISSIFLDINTRWEVILAELWPDSLLQMKNVLPIQMYSVNVGFRYFF